MIIFISLYAHITKIANNEQIIQIIYYASINNRNLLGLVPCFIAIFI